MTTTSPSNAPSDRSAQTRGGPMYGLVIGLAALLALQILGALVLGFRGSELTPAQSQGPVVAFDRDQVSRILIDAPDQNSLVLQKAEGTWRLPGSGDFPAADFKVDELLDKLAKIQKRLPVATSERAAARFKVAHDDFERRLTLEGEGGPLASVYLGDSPGFRRLFVRADEDQAVYEAEFALYDASQKADDWTDKTYLHLTADDIQALQLPDARLELKDETWVLADAAPEDELDQESVKEALRTLSALDFRTVSVPSDQADTPSDTPELTIGIKLTSGETRELKLYKAAEGESRTLEVSDRPYRFELSEYAAEGLTGLNRAALLVKKEVTGGQEGEPDDEALTDSEEADGGTPADEEAPSDVEAQAPEDP